MSGTVFGGSAEETIRQAQGLVKAINTLDISKTNTFIRLLQELNMLGQRMGNLDKLTEAIAQTLSTELRKLTFEISRCEFVINQADRIQESRAQRISDLIEEVRELISLPIEVRPVVEDEEDENNSGGGGNNYGGGISSVNGKNYPSGATYGTYGQYFNSLNGNGDFGNGGASLNVVYGSDEDSKKIHVDGQTISRK